jgi:hypothetical protein
MLKDRPVELVKVCRVMDQAAVQTLRHWTALAEEQLSAGEFRSVLVCASADPVLMVFCQQNNIQVWVGNKKTP